MPQGGVGVTRPLQYLPQQAGHFRRDSPHPAIHPRGAPERKPRIQKGAPPARASPQATATGPRPGNARRQARPSPPGTRTTPGTGGCATRATPTITSWGSPGRRPKPRKSRTSWRGSCATNSRRNSARTRRWSPTPAPGRHGTSATRSPPSTPTARSPAAAGGQRDDRAARAARCDQGQASPLPAPRQTLAPARLLNLDDYDIVQAYGAEYRGIVQLLPARRRRLATQRAALGRRDIHAEDPGSQAQVHGGQDRGKT